MELRIKSFPKNKYPKKGLLIKGSSPSLWLRELDVLGIDLSEIQSFAIPSNEPNVLYGCFLIFKDNAPTEIGKNSYFQCYNNQLFIPENTVFYPKINPKDFRNLSADYIVMHPDFGLVKLSETINWLELIEEPQQADFIVKKVSKGVQIPSEIQHFMVEMDDEKIMETLQKKTEEEWMKDLPFDMKKVMAGNKKEIEKYLKYLDKYPERAVELGVPLDIMGTSRGDGFGRFKFGGGGWLSNFFGGGNSNGNGGGNSGSNNYRWVFWVFLMMIAASRIATQSDKDATQTVKSSGKIENGTLANTLAFRSGVTDIDLKTDSIYRKERGKLMNDFTLASSKYSNRKSMKDVEKDVEEYKVKEGITRDSLKTIYNKKIVKTVEENTENLKRKISDSLKKEGNGIPAKEGVVKTVLNKKKILMADSLGKLYGTIDPPLSDVSQISNFGNKGIGKDDQENVSVSEIFWLVVLLIGVVGLYSMVFQKKKLHIGGENLPIGIKVFLMIVLLAMLSYLFYPLVEMFGYNWFVWILMICVVLLLFRLFREDKTILKSDENE